MSLFEIATAAHLAGSAILALFFVLLARHDRRPYLLQWTAAWIVQMVALGLLLASSLSGGQAELSGYLFLACIHGLLLCAAALTYARGLQLSLRHAAWLLPLAVWAWLGPFQVREAWSLHAAQFLVLAVSYLLAAGILWPLREPAGMGLRLTTNVLGLVGLLYALWAGLLLWAVRPEAGSPAYLEAAPFTVLFLQTLLGLGMVLAVMEATQWALATTNEQLKDAERRLKVLAETDPLTGCFNRRVFRDLVDDVRAQGASGGEVLMIDMDGLKAINDRDGHSAGDDAIRRLADAIKSRTRTTDVLVRWGGDEFVVVLPGASHAEGEGRRAQIAAAVAEAGFQASAGLASYGTDRDIMAAVEEADRAMYRAKAEKKGG